MKVLIAQDESECSQRAFEYVLERNWPVNSVFRIVNVHEPIHGYDPIIYAPHSIVSLKEADREIYTAKEERLKNKLDLLKEKFLNMQVSGDILTGHPKDCIIEEADRWGADIIILGTHGRKGFARALHGSVAAQVAGEAECSVEIIRARNIDKGRSKNG